MWEVCTVTGTVSLSGENQNMSEKSYHPYQIHFEQDQWQLLRERSRQENLTVADYIREAVDARLCSGQVSQPVMSGR